LTTEQPCAASVAAKQWLDGKISMAKMLELEGIPYAQGSRLVGGIWQAVFEKSYALDAELAHKIEASKKFKALAESGDRTTVTESDIIAEAARAAVLQDARSLLRFHLLCFINQTGASV
jgi:hypothetical protein